MSDKYFYLKFTNALTDIIEQYQQETYPDSLGPKGGKISSNWVSKDFMNFYVPLYIRYIEILKNVEDCYDQTTHPQIRKFIKKFLENLICRVCQVKRSLIVYNNPIYEKTKTSFSYVFLDDYLIELKLEPENLNLPIPRYFREDTEYFIKRNMLIDQRLHKKQDHALPEEDIFKFPYEINLNLEEAVKMLQTFEIGRQNLVRINKSLKFAHKKLESELGGDNKILMDDEKKKIVIEHLISIQKVKRAREEEMKSIKMLPSEALEDNLDIRVADEFRKNRKIIQKQKEEDYKNYKKELIENILQQEEYEIKQNMINQRKDWAEKEKQRKKGVPPMVIKEFYKRNDLEKPVEMTEEQKKILEENAKNKLKAEQDKTKKEESQPTIIQLVYDGPSQEIKELTSFAEEFKKNFETPSEYINKKENFIQTIARDEVMGSVEEKIRLLVDAMLDIEIRNKYIIYLKGKKPVWPKDKPEKIPPVKLVPGEKQLTKIDVNDLFTDCIMNGVIRKMVPKNLDDLICDFNYVANSINLVYDETFTIPLFYTKQLVKEMCIYPLGCSVAKNNSPNIPSVLFFGPPGSGKTHAALAVAHHTNSIFIDFSPRNLEKFQSKEELQKAMASAFRTARFNPPAVIYFDNAEQIFFKKASKKDKTPKNPMAIRLRKLLLSFKSAITQDMRVMFIGCSNAPQYLLMKDVNAMFDKSLYFPNPSISDLEKIWRKQITKKIGRPYELEYDLLGKISNGLTGESVISSINYVLSPHRLERLKFSPLMIEEFISTLSKHPYSSTEDHKIFQTFMYEALGMQTIHNYLKEKREENEKTSKKK